MRQFTRQQKMLLASGGGALLVILAMIGVLVTREEPKEEVRTARTVQTIPDAEENKSPESKREGLGSFCSPSGRTTSTRRGTGYDGKVAWTMSHARTRMYVHFRYFHIFVQGSS